MFQEKIEAWLSRKVPERSVNQCFDLPVVLATDIGLQRHENQDRVAAMKITARSSAGRPLIAIAVADGMGGMRDGARCAAIALSSFFFALTLYRYKQLDDRTMAAVLHANDSVFAYSNGNGGATLSAFLIDHDIQPLVANVGDSRVYAFGKNISRLTVDDSLAEAVGGHGRELLQFMGMGTGIRPHIIKVPGDASRIAITTDGIHFVSHQSLTDILHNAPDLKAATDRLAALARWSGGSDNASSALVDVPELRYALDAKDVEGIQLWDPFGSLQTLWLRQEGRNERDQAEHITQERVSPPLDRDAPQPTKTDKQRNRSTAKKPKKPKDGAKEIQFEIEIEQSGNPAQTNDDS
ncbi:PP2C family protein-serine/threonine phosphatase [Mesorhizobium sp. AaZ16]|uniref:PP2C family protein-serine/threonine phosphatase n=1 Tax=Mesorhizobium sp. AaZ16 TaxID=3402289 RepID=UPI00374FAC4F